MPALRVTLPFLASIPVGHELLIQWVQREGVFSGWEEAEPILLDRTTGIVWCQGGTPEHLDHTRFDIEQHTKDLRRSKPMTSGIVRSCQVSTRGAGSSNHLWTILVIDPLPTPSAAPATSR